MYINKLPPELLLYIFEFARDTSYISSSHPLFAILQVCRRWRAVANHFPSLWATLHHHTTSFAAPRPKALERALSLSRNAPLTYCIDQYTYVFDQREDTRLLLEHSHHWLDVQFVVPIEHVPGVTDKTYAFPMLERVHINCSYASASLWASKLFTDASKLREVKLTRAEHPTTHMLPWAQLTSFSSTSTLLEEHFKVLGMAVNLQRYEALANDDFVLPMNCDSPRYVHAKLKSLVISSPVFLRFVNLPALEEVEWVYSFRKTASCDLPEVFHRVGTVRIKAMDVDRTIMQVLTELVEAKRNVSLTVVGNGQNRLETLVGWLSVYAWSLPSKKPLITALVTEDPADDFDYQWSLEGTGLVEVIATAWKKSFPAERRSVESLRWDLVALRRRRALKLRIGSYNVEVVRMGARTL
ncbi:hypothetical protein BDZ89DRAFT_1067286 [Hymenopellis radicata]|nr:hypothetical protein BDZ89DRAFT_1067286 [Hymenopellis radicata]